MQAAEALITCPHCGSRYALPAGALHHGRTVRCAGCRNTWFAQAVDPGETDRLAAAWAEDARRDAHGSDRSAQRHTAPPVTLDGRNPGGETASIEAHPVQRRRRVADPRTSPARKAAAFIVGSGLAAVLAAVLQRDAVVRKAPDLAGLYALAGLPVNLRNLEFRKVVSHNDFEKGLPVLMVDGEIVNVGDADASVPPVALTVRNAAGEPLHTWTIRMAQERASPGEAIRFHASLASPPAAGRDVLITFSRQQGVRLGLAR
jgi:predicted Zn finger-like uncharacterized protein